MARTCWSVADQLQKIDPFDRVQLAEVIRVQVGSVAVRSRPHAVHVSRQSKGTANDADRLRKYLARYQLDWRRLREQDSVS